MACCQLTSSRLQLQRLCNCVVTSWPVAAQALWRGNGTNVIRIAPEVALRFVLHDQLLTMFSPTDGTPLGFSGKLAAGAAAGALFACLSTAVACFDCNAYDKWINRHPAGTACYHMCQQILMQGHTGVEQKRAICQHTAGCGMALESTLQFWHV